MKRTLLKCLATLLAATCIAVAQKKDKAAHCAWHHSPPPPIIKDPKDPGSFRIMNTAGLKFDFTTDGNDSPIAVETALVPVGQNIGELKGHPCYHAPAKRGSVSCTFPVRVYQWVWRRTDGKADPFTVKLENYQDCWPEFIRVDSRK